MAREAFEVESSGLVVPTLSVEEARKAADLAERHYGLKPIQVAENLGRVAADLMVRLGKDTAADLSAAVLVGGHSAGLGAAVAARHLVNRGARISVLLDRVPRGYSKLHMELLSMLAALGLEIQVATEENVTLLMPEGEAPYDRLIDGLGGFDAPRELGNVAAALVRAASHTRAPVLSLYCPTGVDPDSGAPGSDAVEAHATLAAGLPLRGTAEAPVHTGEIWLADISYPRELLSDLGMPIAPLFRAGGLVRLEPLARD